MMNAYEIAGRIILSWLPETFLTHWRFNDYSASIFKDSKNSWRWSVVHPFKSDKHGYEETLTAAALALARMAMND